MNGPLAGLKAGLAKLLSVKPIRAARDGGLNLRKRWWLLVMLAPLLLLGWAGVWSHTGPRVMDEALQVVASEEVTFDPAGDWYVFSPTSERSSTGLILYPGGRIDARAYAPLAAEIAKRGYLVVIPHMPFKLALLAAGRAGQVIEDFPEVELWVVGGHSLGGVAAARFAAKNPAQVAGLVLWAAYPASGDDLSAADLCVTSIYATRDGLSTEEQIRASRGLLPAGARWVEIQGGNHSQFGWYGLQSGDMRASISRQVQAQEIVQATVALLERCSSR